MLEATNHPRDCVTVVPPPIHQKKTTTRKEGNVLFNDALNTFYVTCYMASDIW